MFEENQSTEEENVVNEEDLKSWRIRGIMKEA
jgi:hypothetical protein